MMKNLNSLLWKLTLAFLLVAVTTAALVAVFVRITNQDRLSQLIISQQISNLQTSLTEYYTEHGSWNGVAAQWQQIRLRAVPTPDSPTPAAPGGGHFEPPPGGRQNSFGLIDAQGKVIVSIAPDFPVGSTMTGSAIKSGTALTMNGELIGTILTPPSPPPFNPAENMFLQRTNEALIYAVLGAMVVAMLIGLLLARTLIRPLQALTLAAQNIARGELEQEVKVTSKDEIGQLALAFNKMSREVARANKLRRQMTTDIAHDLRTPLMVIAGYMESMRDGVLQPSTKRLSLIYTEIERLQNLVSDLRMLSQADAGELPLHPQLISPKSILERAAAPFSHRAEMQNITISIEANKDLPRICVDDSRMMQIFSNLLSNALRYTPEGGEIRLSAHSSDGKVILTVEDSGAGIPEEELPYIFDRFYRVDKSRSDAGETGLGLAIVKALVEAHSASIQVESKLGEYTAFHISVPV
jgi:signal transduction histidine kinase